MTVPLKVLKRVASQVSAGDAAAQGSATSRFLLPAGKNNTQSSLRSSIFGSSSQPEPRILAKDTSSRATKEEIEQLLSQIGRDLTPWKESGISLEMVEKAYCTEEIGESMRFQVGLSGYLGQCSHDTCTDDYPQLSRMSNPNAPVVIHMFWQPLKLRC